MKSAKSLLFALSMVSLSAALPLSANADPNIVVHKARCIASDSDIVTIDDPAVRDLGLTRSKFIRARVAAGSQNSAGLRGKVVGLGRPSSSGLRFKALIVTADLSNADPSSCFIVLDFDMPGNEPDQRKIVSFASAKLHVNRPRFKSYIVNNNSQVTGVSNGALKAVAILVQGNGGSQEFTIGAADAFHSGAKTTDCELWLIGEQSSCGLLPNEV